MYFDSTCLANETEWIRDLPIENACAFLYNLLQYLFVLRNACTLLFIYYLFRAETFGNVSAVL